MNTLLGIQNRIPHVFERSEYLGVSAVVPCCALIIYLFAPDRYHSDYNSYLTHE